MMKSSLLSILLLLFVMSTTAFTFQPVAFSSRRSSKLSAQQLQHENDEITTSGLTSRRQALVRAFGGGIVLVGSTISILANNPEVSSASYTAYARREQDWEERKKEGAIEIKTARDLRKQLAEIAPMNNDARSKIFCPNGQTANVSPLMENKCSDRLAIPSVYGRTEDAVGNSIPGFNGGRYTSGVESSSSSNLASELTNVGYGFTSSSRK
jgi:hypothetical protein